MYDAAGQSGIELHFLFEECADMAAEDGTLAPGEKDPGYPFWRCVVCRYIMPIKSNRLDTIHQFELPYWRWRTIHNYMQAKMTGRDFNTYLAFSAAMGYIPDYATPENAVADVAVTRVRHRDAVDFLEKFVIPVAALLPWGHSADNPVTFPESHHLLTYIKSKLWQLDFSRQKFKLQALINHLVKSTEHAFKRYVVLDKKYNLENPVFPPGYETYRLYLCEWTARGCFLAPDMVKKHKNFVARMGRELTHVWWKDHPFLKC
jgi:hypothetical protein